MKYKTQLTITFFTALNYNYMDDQRIMKNNNNNNNNNVEKIEIL